MIYNRILDERRRIETKIANLQSQIPQLPEGKLISTRSGKYSKWVISDGHKQTYLPKDQRPLAEKLAFKKYLLLQLDNLLHEKRAIDFYLKHHDLNAYQKEQSFINSQEYKELLSANFTPLSQELDNWMHAAYEKNNQYPEKLFHKTLSGNRVRSKSESWIASTLYKNKIPFRYECRLQLGDSFVYPDFTIRHPITGELFYWEHFGMMDNPVYSAKTFSKLQLYTSHGIIPTIHLITTFETKENPLSQEMVEKLVEHYFL